jgi:hypothetical protein
MLDNPMCVDKIINPRVCFLGDLRASAWGLEFSDELNPIRDLVFQCDFGIWDLGCGG